MAGSGSAHLRPSDETLLRAENLVVEFPVGTTGLKVHAVSDVSFDLREGETLGLVGESGCGKSTTGRALMLVPPPTAGSIALEGENLLALDKDQVRSLRSRLQMIFQDPISSLNPRRTVRDIVAEPLTIQWGESFQRPWVARTWERYAKWMVRTWRWAWTYARYALPVLGIGLLMWLIGDAATGRSLDGALGWLKDVSPFVYIPGLVAVAPFAIGLAATFALWLVLVVLLPFASIPRMLRMRSGRAEFNERADAKVHEVLSTVGLDPDTAMPKRPHEFSGGQCQRICIARALVLDPKVIICDEPVSALDVSVQAQILNLLEDMKAAYGLTLVFIAHDLAVVKNVSDRVAVMYLGKICEVAPSDDIYEEPAHPYTAALLSAIPVPDPTIDQREIRGIGGELPSPIAPPSGCRFRTRCPRAQERCATEEPVMRGLNDGHFVACHFPLVGEEAPASDLGGEQLAGAV
ncbi:MAG: oligopeptide/dipeptide ABC transporter ATP-binding protein [Actinomycetota bacterium]|nr:oligopeptide/dipeptide ABC transporter ATP-binding protein [Actinomycetota bacterium]